MPPATPRSEALLAILRRQRGVATSAELGDGLGLSQPTVSRALAPLIASGQVRKVGAARSQRYLLPRPVRGVGTEVTILRVSAQGVPAPFARMVPLSGGGFWVDEADGVSERHDGLPWFLADMRPQGFMGRNFAHVHPELQLPTDPRHWSDDDALRALPPTTPPWPRAHCRARCPGRRPVASSPSSAASPRAAASSSNSPAPAPARPTSAPAICCCASTWR